MDGDKEMNSYRVYHNGKEVYDNLYANLKKIQKEYPDYFDKNVGFLSVANNRNTDEGIISFFNKEFGKSSDIHQLSSRMVVNYDKWNSMRRKDVDVKKDDRNNQLLDYINFFSGNFYRHYGLLLDDSRIVQTPTGTCVPFYNRLFITARKDIIVCERIGFEHTLGRISNEGIDVNFENIAKFYNNILNKFKAQCESCLVNEACDVCFFTDEKYFEKNFKCKYFYSVNQLKKCIAASLKILRKRALEI